MNQEAEDGGGRAEGGYLVVLNLLKNVGWGEFLVVVDEYRCATDPLPVYLPPSGLSPSCVCNGEVEARGLEVVPEVGHADESDGVGKVVSDHLRLTRSAAGEVDNHRVVVRIS